MAKEPQELKWLENLLPEQGFRRKGMFGGFAYYLDDKMIMATFESTDGNRSYKGKVYDFEIWNGCMFPVEHELQDKALKRFPFLVNHPILPKWLYLPMDTESFDELVSEVISQVIRPNSYWGSIPKGKAKKGKAAKVPSAEKIDTKIDTRKPRMFSDEPVEVKLQQAKKLSDLKNIGPVFEKLLLRAGIKTPQKLFDLGWQKAMTKIAKVDSKTAHAMYAYALIGAVTNKDWGGISEAEKQEAKDLMKSLRGRK